MSCRTESSTSSVQRLKAVVRYFGCDDLLQVDLILTHGRIPPKLIWEFASFKYWVSAFSKLCHFTFATIFQFAVNARRCTEIRGVISFVLLKLERPFEPGPVSSSVSVLEIPVMSEIRCPEESFAFFSLGTISFGVNLISFSRLVREIERVWVSVALAPISPVA